MKELSMKTILFYQTKTICFFTSVMQDNNGQFVHFIQIHHWECSLTDYDALAIFFHRTFSIGYKVGNKKFSEIVFKNFKMAHAPWFLLDNNGSFHYHFERNFISTSVPCPL